MKSWLAFKLFSSRNWPLGMLVESQSHLSSQNKSTFNWLAVRRVCKWKLIHFFARSLNQRTHSLTPPPKKKQLEMIFNCQFNCVYANICAILKIQLLIYKYKFTIAILHTSSILPCNFTSTISQVHFL
jgi:hypothetical protein